MFSSATGLVGVKASIGSQLVYAIEAITICLALSCTPTTICFHLNTKLECRTSVNHKVRKLTADEVAALPDDVIAAARAFLESCKREAA